MTSDGQRFRVLRPHARWTRGGLRGARRRAEPRSGAQADSRSSSASTARGLFWTGAWPSPGTVGCRPVDRRAHTCSCVRKRLGFNAAQGIARVARPRLPGTGVTPETAPVRSHRRAVHRFLWRLTPTHRNGVTGQREAGRRRGQLPPVRCHALGPPHARSLDSYDEARCHSLIAGLAGQPGRE